MYLDHLKDIAQADVEGLLTAERSYGDSWKKRGGVGAFMMLARKWDRIEKQVARTADQCPAVAGVTPGAYDIFTHLAADRRPEGLIDDIRDLRRYLMLVEAEFKDQMTAPAQPQLPFREDQPNPFGYQGA